MSLERLQEHRRLWESKPVLHEIYGVWFDALLQHLPDGARVLEVGAGPGRLAEHARTKRPDLRWVAMDLLATPWNSLAGNALRMPLRTGSLDAVVGVDFIHHLAQPGLFFEEVSRVLSRGGQLVVVEPWVTPFSYPIYRFLHQERCTLGIDPWNPFPTSDNKLPFDGDAAIFSTVIRKASQAQWQAFGLSKPTVTLWNAFAYLLSLGYRPASLLPRGILPWLLRLDTAVAFAAHLFGLRALASWTRL